MFGIKRKNRFHKMSINNLEGEKEKKYYQQIVIHDSQRQGIQDEPHD